MPRQIIDTESSRPAYNRRRLRPRDFVAVLVVAALAAAAGPYSCGARPGNSGRCGNPGGSV